MRYVVTLAFSVFCSQPVTAFADDAFARQIVGRYAVAIGGVSGCSWPDEWANIYFTRRGEMIASNECGLEAKIGLDGTIIHYGSITGHYNSYFGVIYFSNGIQWVRGDGLFSKTFGYYNVAGGTCHDHYSRGHIRVWRGRLHASNECGHDSELQITEIGNMIAVKWGNLQGVPDYNGTISWANGTDWYKTSP